MSAVLVCSPCGLFSPLLNARSASTLADAADVTAQPPTTKAAGLGKPLVGRDPLKMFSKVG
jgi:hypothetical protein